MIDASTLQAVIDLMALVVLVSLLRFVLVFLQDDAEQAARRKRRR